MWTPAKLQHWIDTAKVSPTPYDLSMYDNEYIADHICGNNAEHINAIEKLTTYLDDRGFKLFKRSLMYNANEGETLVQFLRRYMKTNAPAHLWLAILNSSMNGPAQLWRAILDSSIKTGVVSVKHGGRPIPDYMWSERVLYDPIPREAVMYFPERMYIPPVVTVKVGWLLYEFSRSCAQYEPFTVGATLLDGDFVRNVQALQKITPKARELMARHGVNAWNVISRPSDLEMQRHLDSLYLSMGTKPFALRCVTGKCGTEAELALCKRHVAEYIERLSYEAKRDNMDVVAPEAEPEAEAAPMYTADMLESARLAVQSAKAKARALEKTGTKKEKKEAERGVIDAQLHYDHMRDMNEL